MTVGLGVGIGLVKAGLRMNLQALMGVKKQKKFGCEHSTHML